MPLYCYIKAPPKKPLFSKFSVSGQTLSLASILLGIVFIVNTLLPIGLYEIQSQRFKSRLVSPVEVLGESNSVVDYSRPESWFPTAPLTQTTPSRITHYTISIPKLKINEATVQIGGKDLMRSLIHYSGTALPGQYGNAVIYGHSVLPTFYNPKNYRTIFSTLPTLEKGDEIYVNFDGIDYLYRIFDMFEVTPDDVSVLEQRYDGEYLSLITCVPPGTYIRRLIVKARLVKI